MTGMGRIDIPPDVMDALLGGVAGWEALHYAGAIRGAADGAEPWHMGSRFLTTLLWTLNLKDAAHLTTLLSEFAMEARSAVADLGGIPADVLAHNIVDELRAQSVPVSEEAALLLHYIIQGAGSR
jgi:hypothetical protein